MKKASGVLCCLFVCVTWALSSAVSAAPASGTAADPAKGVQAAGPADGAAAAGNTDEYCGEYFLPSGKRVSVYKSGVITEMARLVFVNWENGRVGALVKDGADRFWAASSPTKPDVRQTVITFGRDRENKIDQLMIAEGTGTEMKAERKETFTQKPVTFANGDVVLAGTLKMPLRRGPFPAIVLIHGSGPGTREQVESNARFFVHLGMAVLSYDKRGCGASGGDWKTVDLDVLADDALAGVTMLAALPNIDPRRIGLWGISQGGWIAPLAAAKSMKVAFVINHSGPGTSLRRQDTYMTASVLADQDVPASDIDLVVAALNTLYDYGRKKASAEQLDAAVALLQGKPGLEEYASLSSSALIPDSLYAQQAIGDPAWFFHLDPDRDALQPYRTLRCPLLVMYGKLDYTVPVEESAVKITAVLEKSGHPDFLVKVMERTGHGWTVMQPDHPEEPVEPLSIAPECFSLVEEWLKSHGMCGAAKE
jgi:dienelactone hydrolase